jgi:hypothetical protein
MRGQRFVVRFVTIAMNCDCNYMLTLALALLLLIKQRDDDAAPGSDAAPQRCVLLDVRC